MTRIKNYIEYLKTDYSKSLALSLLRIFVCFHLAKKIVIDFPYMRILYSNHSIIAWAPINYFGLKIPALFFHSHYQLLIISEVILITLFFFGIGKNITALLLFLLIAFIQKLEYLTLNGGDNLLYFILLYLVFTDCYKYFSIKPIKFNNTKVRRLVNLISSLACLSIMVHLCLSYFISAINKIHASVWFHGIAVHYTMLLERFMGTPFNHYLANNEYFVVILTYFTVIFELYFPILIFIKKTRPYIAILGIILHMGIYIFMMIYDFEFVYLATYIVFFHDSEILGFKHKYLDKLLLVINKRGLRSVSVTNKNVKTKNGITAEAEK